jgi:hypothetical protein
MTSIEVTTQAELNAALKRDDLGDIFIVSPKGVWLEISSSGSATVTAYDSATVTAYDSATVRAYGSATVRAYGSATVTAYDSATVRAYGSATVRAYDSATVRAYGSATVTAGSHVAVHLHNKRVKVTGGVVIDVTDLDLDDPATWCAYGAVEVADGKAILFKATDKELTAGRDYDMPTVYTPGTTVTAEDWSDEAECGHGLHLSQSPAHAEEYRPTYGGNRFLKVEVDLASVVVLGNDKVKVPSCRVLAEVDVHGRDVPQAVK